MSYSRPGQDVRYSLDDSKLRRLGWEPKADFDKELVKIVSYYKDRFIW
jgi:dTDP-D-glucose 4,6-dehydratase